MFCMNLSGLVTRWITLFSLRIRFVRTMSSSGIIPAIRFTTCLFIIRQAILSLFLCKWTALYAIRRPVPLQMKKFVTFHMLKLLQVLSGSRQKLLIIFILLARGTSVSGGKFLSLIPSKAILFKMMLLFLKVLSISIPICGVLLFLASVRYLVFLFLSQFPVFPLQTVSFPTSLPSCLRPSPIVLLTSIHLLLISKLISHRF